MKIKLSYFFYSKQREISLFVLNSECQHHVLVNLVLLLTTKMSVTHFVTFFKEIKNSIKTKLNI